MAALHVGARRLRDRGKAARFSGAVQQIFAPPETVVCRCELVSRGEIDETLAANPGMVTASAVKLECRSGMGPCQGRYCEGSVSALIASARGRSIESAGRFSAHFPVKPVAVGALADPDPHPHI